MSQFKHKVVFFHSEHQEWLAYVIMVKPGSNDASYSFSSSNNGMPVSGLTALVVAGWWQGFCSTGSPLTWGSSSPPPNYINRQNCPETGISMQPGDGLDSVVSSDRTDPHPDGDFNLQQPFRPQPQAYVLRFDMCANMYMITPTPPYHFTQAQGNRDFRWLLADGDEITIHVPEYYSEVSISFTRVSGNGGTRNNPFWEAGGPVKNTKKIALSPVENSFKVVKATDGAKWSFDITATINGRTHTVDPEMQIGSGGPGSV